MFCSGVNTCDMCGHSLSNPILCKYLKLLTEQLQDNFVDSTLPFGSFLSSLHLFSFCF